MALSTIFRCCNISFGFKGTSGLGEIERHLARIARRAIASWRLTLLLPLGVARFSVQREKDAAAAGLVELAADGNLTVVTEEQRPYAAMAHE